MENNNLNQSEESILSKENITEILELEQDSVVEIKVELDHEEVDELTNENINNIKVSRDNYTEQEVRDKICIICGKTNCRGIIIMDKKICLECEEKAIKADIKSDFYSDYKDKIIKNVVGKLKNQNLG
ncbi:MAG: sigma factor G inhibitor Gin [Sarcina sp.]